MQIIVTATTTITTEMRKENERNVLLPVPADGSQRCL